MTLVWLHQAAATAVPNSFNHGTSEQRTRWFRKAFESGDGRVCDTFNAGRL